MGIREETDEEFSKRKEKENIKLKNKISSLKKQEDKIEKQLKKLTGE